MITITLNINERTKAGKALKSIIEIFSKESNGVEIVSDTQENPYDPEFVKMVLEAKASKNRHLVKNVDDLWESL
ncbi:MAG: hypothetical protein J5I59_13845 [Saprospiraceae bacterium]|nr:hypothetical protein [Saprospiraceae bacterium]